MDTVFHTTTSRFVTWFGDFSQERQDLWLTKDDLKDSPSWSSPPIVLLRDIHNDLLVNYDYKDSVPPPNQPGPRVHNIFFFPFIWKYNRLLLIDKAKVKDKT